MGEVLARLRVPSLINNAMMVRVFKPIIVKYEHLIFRVNMIITNN